MARLSFRMFRVDRIEDKGTMHGVTSQGTALNPSDHRTQNDDCGAFDYDVDEAPTVQTMFMANLSSADPVYDNPGRQNRGQGNNARGAGAAGYGEAHNRVEYANPDNVVDNDVDEQTIQDLALNVDNVFQDDDGGAFDYDVDEAPTAQTMFMANLS
nr:integrase, catalytic region, zinc finger, CCHC-type, peptidase aspartic, catalytic [Tanacetum cinerariifolium]